jgi:hypothetical protein
MSSFAFSTRGRGRHIRRGWALSISIGVRARSWGFRSGIRDRIGRVDIVWRRGGSNGMHDLDGENEAQLVALPTSAGMQFTRKQCALCTSNFVHGSSFPTTLVLFFEHSIVHEWSTINLWPTTKIWDDAKRCQKCPRPVIIILLLTTHFLYPDSWPRSHKPSHSQCLTWTLTFDHHGRHILLCTVSVSVKSLR